MATLIYPDLTAIAEESLVEGTADNDLIMVMGDMLSDQDGRNVINSGTGDDSIAINGRLISQNGAQYGNQINTGTGNNTVIIGQGASATEQGLNEVIFAGGANSVSELFVTSEISSATNGSNRFIVEEGYLHAETLGWHAQTGGSNLLDSNRGGTVAIDGDMLAEGGRNRLSNHQGLLSDSEYSITISGNVIARGDGGNSFYADTGTKTDISIQGSVITEEGGQTSFGFGQNGAPFSLQVGGDFIANNGYNDIDLTSPSTNFTVGGTLKALDGGFNRLLMLGINLNEDEPTQMYIEVAQGMVADAGITKFEVGSVSGGHEPHNLIMNISGNLDGHNQNGNALVAANGGINEIQGGVGNSLIQIFGGVDATEDSSNLITMRQSDDRVSLNGKIATGALDIALNDGYDVLALNSNSYSAFTSNYQDWLTDLQANDAIESMGIEALEVSLGRPTNAGLNSLDWLEQLISSHNAVSDNDIELRLNIDKASRLGLDDLFSSSREDIFSALDMSGGFSNQLMIDGSFADNDMDGQFLRVLGDGNDSVKLSNDWSLAQSGYTDETGLIYDRYTNAADELLIQSNISVV